MAHGKNFITREDAREFAEKEAAAAGNELPEEDKKKVINLGISLIFGERKELSFEEYVRNRDSINYQILEKQKNVKPPTDREIRRAQPTENQPVKKNEELNLQDLLKMMLNSNTSGAKDPLSLNQPAKSDSRNI